jgi:hypothetical protein
MNFRKIKIFIFALILAFGVAGASGLSNLSSVQAQHPQKMSPTDREAFRDGYRMGRDDARARRRYDYNSSRMYRRGDRDYREDFRKGYKQGYGRG